MRVFSERGGIRDGRSSRKVLWHREIVIFTGLISLRCTRYSNTYISTQRVVVYLLGLSMCSHERGQERTSPERLEH